MIEKIRNPKVSLKSDIEGDLAAKKAPWELAMLALIPIIALYLSEDGSPVLPMLGALILISYILPFRVRDTPPLIYVVRALAYLIVIGMNMLRQNSETINMFDIRTMRWVGELAATELTVRFWLAPLTKEKIGGGIVFSGITLMSACSTLDERFIPFLTPIYILLLLFSLRLIRPGIVETLTSRSIKTYSFIAFSGLALALGGAHFIVLHNFRNEISSLATKFLNDHGNKDSGQLSLNPSLGSRFGDQGSPGRALRIEGEADISHMRASTFEFYRNGSWRPDPLKRVFTPLFPADMNKSRPGAKLSITRFTENSGIIFLPLNCTFAALATVGELDWNREAGGPVRSDPSPALTYNCIVNEDAEAQGFLTQPPATDYEKDLLDVPESIDPKVKLLAKTIVGSLSTPRDKVDAIQTYLLSNHKYSLNLIIRSGDPISVFLLEKRAAHCEYFGSAMAILARCAGVPARYVVGYYAHESEKPGVTIVRQRDAHAWCECWIENKGWVTVDATPGEGRPDKLYGDIPFLQMWGERWQDFILGLKVWLQKTDKRKLVLGVLGALLISGGVYFWISRLPKTKALSSKFTYASPEAALVSLFSRFENLMRKNCMVCPPSLTWMNFISGFDEKELLKTGMDRTQLLDFVNSYNSSRFGETDDKQIERLSTLLDDISNSIAIKGQA